MFATIFLNVHCDHPLHRPHHVHHPHPQPEYHHQPHYEHVPGFLEVHYSDYGRSDVKYDYGYGRRNHLHTIIGHPHHYLQHHF